MLVRGSEGVDWDMILLDGQVGGLDREGGRGRRNEISCEGESSADN